MSTGLVMSAKNMLEITQVDKNNKSTVVNSEKTNSFSDKNKIKRVNNNETVIKVKSVIPRRR